jgi:tetratricopeptide (TPR) repeat protein
MIVLLMAASPILAGEGFLRLTDARLADDPYLNFGQVDSFFVTKELNGEPYYQVANREVYRERNTMFPLRKPANAFRVFCLGGSASAGWPHPADEIYSAYLRNALQRTYPDRVIEVINVSAHAYAAYRVRLIFQQIIHFDPDLIIIYSGNNEFIEKRVYSEHESWVSPAMTALDHLYLVRRIKGSSLGRRLWPENTLLPEERQHVAYEQWSKIEQLALDLRRKPDQYEKVKEHYRFSIQSMVSAARERSVPVILLTVPVNLRDWHPNVSYQPLEGESLTRWTQHYRDGRRSLLAGDATSAVRAFSTATRLSPLHAESQFMLGLALERTHEYEAALQAYSQARDLDHNPFRAPSTFNEILRQVAAQYDNVSLVDADRIFRTASAPFAPGFDLFLDYVHPTKRGNLLIARAVYEKIVERRLVGGEAANVMDSPVILTAQSSSKEAYDEQRDYAMQGVMVRLFVMMHQYESALQKATALHHSPGAMDALRNGEDAKLIEGVLEVFPTLIAQEHADLFDGSNDSSTRRPLDSRLKDFYRDNFGGYSEFRSLAPST